MCPQVMAPILKRKSAPPGPDAKPTVKRLKVNGDEKPKKKRTRDSNADNQSQPASQTKELLTTSKKSHSSSVPAKEQPAFPRGGAGVLTALERKQIQIKAEQDALAEHNGTSDIFGAHTNVDGLSDQENSEGDEVPSRRKVKSKRKEDKKTSVEYPGKKSYDSTSLRIEGLKHRNLTEGALVLGRVQRITHRGLLLALPNNLVGHVALTEISPQFTESIRNQLEGVTGGEDEPGEQDEDETNLNRYFRVGCFLRAVVVPSHDESSTQTKKERIDLSIQPHLVNVGLAKSNLAAGCTVQVSIASVEDHGLIVDTGIQGNSIGGFIPTKQAGSAFDINSVKIGAVLLCTVNEVGSSGRTIKLSADSWRPSVSSEQYVLRDAPTVNCLLPGTLVELLLSQVSKSGLSGKIMGMLDSTADVVHSGACEGIGELQKRFSVGKKLKGRLTFTHLEQDGQKLGFSILPHVLQLNAQDHADEKSRHDLSKIISDAEVVHVEPGLGIYLQLPDDALAFAHKSRLSDSKTESLAEDTGKFRVGSKHQIRILEYNSIDRLYLVSLQESILQKPFLRLEDVEIGSVQKAKISRILIGEKGIKGLIVDLAEDINGLVPEAHLSDVVLKHAERKFREGLTVSVRVLSTDRERRQMRLTLKKSLVNSDQKLWKTYDDVSVGDSTPGTLVKVESRGALVQFYGEVKGFLPVSEMSEAYIRDATEHFRVGQTVSVTALSVDAEIPRLILSCRDLSNGNQSIESALASLAPGVLVNGVCFEKSEDDLLLRLEESNLIARLTLDHVSDGSLNKRRSAMAKLRIGQRLQDLLLLDVQRGRRLVIVSNRNSLVEALKAGTLLKSFEDLREGNKLTGYVTNITPDGVFVGFAGGITGVIPKSLIADAQKESPDFGMTRLDAVSATVSSIDYKESVPRFWLTMKGPDSQIGLAAATSKAVKSTSPAMLTEPLDENIQTLEDLVAGKTITVRVASIKETQLNVEIAKDVQGRIDASEAFQSWDEIKDRKRPLKQFSVGDRISAKILGVHDARNHKFLPISHRSGKTSVFELTAKSSAVNTPGNGSLALTDVEPGSTWLAFVNNVLSDCLWVNLSPNVRGKIRAVDAADDLSLAADLGKNFPVGSALRVKVLSVDLDKNRLDLSARQGASTEPLSFKDISKGLILPGRITKVSDRQLLVQLSDSLVGAVDLIDMADDYALANPANFEKNQVVRVYVVEVDSPNKKIVLSLRRSKVMSSSLPVQDPEVTAIGQLGVGDIRRGFIKNVADTGIFVVLGHGVTALVRVTNVSDAFLKEWKDHFQRDQLIKGRIISIDEQNGRIQMTLKESALERGYVPRKVFADMHVGDIVTAKVAKVETFGVFIVVDNSENVRGLCHRSEIAEKRIEDASSLFSEGDAVTAKVLKIDAGQRRINFGMKASYFPDGSRDSEDSASESEGGAIISRTIDQLVAETEAVGHTVELNEVEDSDGASLTDHSDIDDANAANVSEQKSIFDTLSFDFNTTSKNWTGQSLKRTSYNSDTEDERSAQARPKKKKRAVVQVDHSADLDKQGPQSASDYERLLLSDPDSSLLWLQYMAHHLEQGDIDLARAVGEKALKSIGTAQDAEKLNIWIALLNLENAYGDTDGNSLRVVLQRALEYNDAAEMHARLASIYINSGKHQQADELFKEMTRQQRLGAHDPKTWINYATFLFDTLEKPDRARELLPPALKVLPSYTQLNVTSKFAQLEFRCKTGVPERGRTIFEGLLASFPKRVDLFNVLLDLEMKLASQGRGEGGTDQVRGVFERVFAGEKGKRLKPKQAKFFFKRWLAFEEAEGDERRTDEVKRRAAEYVREAVKS